MIFETERELQETIAELDFEFFTSHPISFTRREVRVGGCIPDLVSIHFKKDPTIHPWPSRWSYKHSFAVWLLRDQALSIEDIAASFFEPVERVSPIIDNLLSSGVAVELRNKKINLAKHVQINSRANVTAVEAKLKNWRQALAQAIRYKDFANVVVVAMDATMIPTKDVHLDQFRAEQVGLCAVSYESIEWIVPPKIREEGIGHEKEGLVMSATIPTTQRFWARRKD